MVRRPAVAALLSIEIVTALILISRFKYDKLWMTVDFVDLMIIDRDTSAFLLAAFPSLRGWIGLAALGSAALLTAPWRFDPYRVPQRGSLAGGLLCLITLVGMSLLFPTNLNEEFHVVFSEPAGAAYPFHDQLAGFAVGGPEIVGVAGRDFCLGCDGSAR